MLTNPASLFLPLLLLQCAAPAWTQGLTTPLFSPPPLPCSSSTTYFTSSSLPVFLTCCMSLIFLPRPHPPTVAIYLHCHRLMKSIFLLVHFIMFSLFLFQCEAVLWSYDVDPGDSDWSRLRLPPPPPHPLNLSAPVQHIPFRLLFWIVGVFFEFYFCIF